MPLHTDLAQAFEQLRSFDSLLKTDPAAALSLVTEANTVVRSHGLESGHLAHLAAVVYLAQGKPLEALAASAESLRRDPMQPRFHEVRAALLAHLADEFKAAPLDAPHLTPWYEVLLAEGGADVDVHLSWARHLLAKGNAQAALRLLDALALLAPAAAAVAAVRAEAYEATGKVDAARACREGIAEFNGKAQHQGHAHA